MFGDEIPISLKPESRTQVFMFEYGVLAVHDDVKMKANTAEVYGGAVSLQSNFPLHSPVVVFGDSFCKG